MWSILKYIFFKLDAEKAHYLAMDLLSFALKIPIFNYFLKKSFHFESDKLKTTVCGMEAKNPIGLAAGFDKDGRWLEVLSLIGFGHIELGTVTPIAQKGNPKPRLYRLKKDQSVINRMGFNNEGVNALVEKIRKFNKPEGLIIGGNIGKNKITPAEKAADDYLNCFQKLFDYVDYFTINVSSPNTPGLRQLQDKEPLEKLLSSIQFENEKHPNPKPLFLKIAPDLEPRGLDDIIDVVISNRFSGIIICNTTIDRPSSLVSHEIAKESGGLSGKALTLKAIQTLEYIKSKANSRLILIGVGGIMNSIDAIKRIESGAHWIQIYTGMIFEGPWFIKQLKKTLASKN